MAATYGDRICQTHMRITYADHMLCVLGCCDCFSLVVRICAPVVAINFVDATYAGGDRRVSCGVLQMTRAAHVATHFRMCGVVVCFFLGRGHLFLCR